MVSANFHLAFIDGLGGPELMVIMFIILMLFGGQRLPELARGLGKSIKEFKKATAGVEEEIKRVIESPPPAAKPAPLVIAPPATAPAPGAISATSVTPPTSSPTAPSTLPPRDTRDDAGATDI